MKLYVNEEEHQEKSAISLAALMRRLGHSDFAGMAVAVNGRVIPKKDWDGYQPRDEDRLTVIRAIQGG